MTATAMVLTVLACWGLLALWLHDSVSMRARRWLLGTDEHGGSQVGHGRLHTLLSCPPCLAFWVMLVLTVPQVVWGSAGVWEAAGLVIGGRTVAGVLAVYLTPRDEAL